MSSRTNKTFISSQIIYLYFLVLSYCIKLASLVNFIKYLREKLCQLSVISSRRQKQKEYFLTCSMKLHYSNSKSKDIKRKLQTSISHELKTKISSTNINKSNAKMYEKNCTHHVQRDLFHVGKDNLIP